MKTSLFSRLKRSVFVTLAAVGAGAAFAAEKQNAYDQLGATLLPIAKVFTPKGEHRAIRATLVLEAMTGVPAEQLGGRLEVAVQPPVRALLRGEVAGREVTLVRVGQELRISPPELSGVFGPQKKLSAKERKKAKGLDPLVLPFPPEQLALLPVLFTVKELPRDPEGLRVLEVALMPELARSISRKYPEARVEEWRGRLSLREGQLARLTLARPGWGVTVRVEGLELLKGLPPETWVAGEREGALTLSGVDARRWLNGLGKVLNREAERVAGDR